MPHRPKLQAEENRMRSNSPSRDRMGAVPRTTVFRLALFLLALPLFPQPALYIDLSGEWRQCDNDTPAIAQPDFDEVAGNAFDSRRPPK